MVSTERQRPVPQDQPVSKFREELQGALQGVNTRGRRDVPVGDGKWLDLEDGQLYLLPHARRIND